MPPITQATKALNSGTKPIVGVIVPLWATNSTAAIPASRPETAKALAITTLARIPINLVASKS